MKWRINQREGIAFRVFAKHFRVIAGIQLFWYLFMLIFGTLKTRHAFCCSNIQMKRFNTNSACSGMTLVEVVVAMTLLAIGLAGGYSAISMSMQMRKYAHDNYVGTLIANNQIERAKNLPLSQVGSLVESETQVDELGTGAGTLRFRRTTVLETNWNSIASVAKIDVMVGVPLPRQAGFSTTTVSTLLREIEP